MVLCKFFQQGHCRYGDSCRFEHDRGRFEDVAGISPMLRASQQHTPSLSSTRGQQSQLNVFGSRQHTQSQNLFSSQSQPSPPSEHNVFSSRSMGNSTDIRDIYKILIQELDVSERSGQWPLSCLNPVPSRVHGNIPGLEDHSPDEVRWLLYESCASGGLENYKQQIEMLYQQAQVRKNALKTPNAEVFTMLETLMRGPPPSSQQFTFALPGSDSWPASAASVFPGSQLPGFGTPSNSSSSSSLFGGTPNSTSTTVFAGGNQNQTSAFGNSSTSAFGTNVTHSPVFGGSSPASSFHVTGQNNLFGGSSSIASNFTFKLPDQITPGQSAGSSVFGGQVSTGHSVFGASGNEQSGGVFTGFQPIPGSQPVESSSVMNISGKLALSSSSGFGDTLLYTDLSTLTPEEKKEFSAATFTVGRIPIRPPPKELCD